MEPTKQGESYIRDTGDFLAKLKTAGEVPKGVILVTVDVVGPYPRIPHREGLGILKKQYENYPSKKVSTEDIGKMADFILKNNLFEFDSKFYINKYQERLLDRSLPLRMLVFFGPH